MTSSRHDIATVGAFDPPIKILQLTDTHLGKVRGTTLLGMDTDHSLQCVIKQAHKENPEVDLILATGDLSDGGSNNAYQRLITYLEEFSCPSFWLPGNHDERVAMESATVHSAKMVREIRVGNWQILMLDSQVPGEVGGELGAQELEFLQQALAAGQQEALFALVCLHHHPVDIGCDWLDEQRVADSERFFEILQSFPAVRGVLWGHVHQELETLRGDMKLMASPSTCIQFAPHSSEFKIDDSPPGYRRLALHGDGRIETDVPRVWDVTFKVDLDSGGYL